MTSTYSFDIRNPKRSVLIRDPVRDPEKRFDNGARGVSMTHPSFKYDVAFSFLERDEDLVVQVDALLRGRVNTFVPSRRAAFLAHTDFEQTVHRVFECEARIVAVFYRGSWGRSRLHAPGRNRCSGPGPRRRVRVHPPHPSRHAPFPSSLDPQKTDLAGSRPMGGGGDGCCHRRKGSTGGEGPR